MRGVLNKKRCLQGPQKQSIEIRKELRGFYVGFFRIVSSV